MKGLFHRGLALVELLGLPKLGSADATEVDGTHDAGRSIL